MDMVSVLPATIVGPAYGPLALPMTLLDRILRGALSAAPDLQFTYLDAATSPGGMITVAAQGRAGERYLLAGDQAMSITRLAELACQVSDRARCRGRQGPEQKGTGWPARGRPSGSR